MRFRNISTNVLLIMWALAQFGFTFIFSIMNNKTWKSLVMIIGLFLLLTIFLTY
jgi:hypothetical protein